MVSIQCGQSALLPFPKQASKKTSLTDTKIAPSLKVHKSAVKDEGMLVYKVDKVRAESALSYTPGKGVLWKRSPFAYFFPFISMENCKPVS